MNARLAAIAALAATALLSAAAHAEGPVGGIALNQLEPTPAGDPFFGVASPFIGGHLVPRGVVLFDWAGEPLAVTSTPASGAVVASQAFLHLDASIALWDRLLVSLLLPIAISQSGDSVAVRSTTFTSPSSPEVGDLRLGLRVRLAGSDETLFQIGVGAYAHLPTGLSNSYVGEGAARISPTLLLGGKSGFFLWSLGLGVIARASDNPSSFASSAGIGFLLWDERLQLSAEAFASTLLQEGSFRVTEQRSIPRELLSTNAEVLFGGRVRILHGLAAGIAAGPGLTTAMGTPAYRIVASVGWTPDATADEGRPDDMDADADGIRDPEDACPYASGPKSAKPKRNGCPILDGDEDGVADDEDACPDTWGAKDADPKKHGCPVALPGEASSEAAPAPPASVAGPAPGDMPAPAAPPAAAADRDGDGVADTQDACPNEKGAAGADAATSGCPQRVRVKGDEIALLEQVQFRPPKVGSPPAIDPASEPLLGEIRDVIGQHPEFSKIEIQGHTDNVGNAKFNETISAARAEAVKKWLVEHGVAADRLTSKGYGVTKPIADNATAAGRAANRRIQIVVTEKK